MAVNLDYLKYKAYQLRVLSLEATTAAGSGHPTSALSAADMVAALYFHALNYDYTNPYNEQNDRFILSKGHAVPVVYAALEQLGVISKQELLTLRQFNSVLEGHPTPRFIYNEAATGSLGNGLSIGLGMALSSRLSGHQFHVYVMLGDSEMSEGSNWEACELAAFYKVDNLIALIDVNRLGQSTQTMEGHDLESYRKKLQAFGWHTLIIDGHNMEAIVQALSDAKKTIGKPTVIIAKTYKGHGLNAKIEDYEQFHGKAFSQDQLPELLSRLAQAFPKEAHAHYKAPEPIETHPIKPKVPIIELNASDYKLGQQLATRKAYGQILALLGAKSNRIISLDAEVKNSTFAELFEQKFPDRFFQCFIAEQNMVNMAIGFQARGYIPFVSTFGAFLTRAHDQIRMAAIGRAALRIAGSHAGVSIGQDGPSQMALEDIAQMRALPNSMVFYPSDAVSAYGLMQIMANYQTGISYLRLTRSDTPVIYDRKEVFTAGGCKVLKRSKHDELCIIAAGVTLFEALKAHELLQKDGIPTAVVDLYSIKPLAESELKEIIASSQGKFITVEDHFIEGGLGEAVCYALRNDRFTSEVLAVKEVSRSGKPEELLAYHGIDAHSIVNTAKKMVKRK